MSDLNGMKLVVLGANGGTGVLVVQQALERGAEVTAVVRSHAQQIEMTHDNLKVVVGDPCDQAFLTCVFAGKEVVISTLGGKRPTKRAISIYWMSALAIRDAAQGTSVTRVDVTSTALLFPLNGLRDRLLAVLARQVVRNAHRMEDILQGADFDVVIARCGFLTNSTEQGYRVKDHVLPPKGSSVSRAGLTRCLLDKVLTAGPVLRSMGSPARLR